MPNPAMVSRRYRPRRLRYAPLALLLGLGGCGMGPVTIPAPVVALERDKDELAILSYNVQALPAFLGKWNARSRLRAIRELTPRYDIVLLQEGFFWWGDMLPRAGHGLATLTGDPTRCLLGSGLAMQVLPTVRLDSGSAHAFPRSGGYCAGWILDGADCLARKGFIWAEVTANGRTFHVYNTHIDAGRGANDSRTRKRQLDSLAAFIMERSEGYAVIVAGDMNIDPRTDADAGLLEAFADSLGLRRITPNRSPDWGQWLDHFFVRDGRDVSLDVRASGEDPAFQRHRRYLSDHPPIFIIVRVAGVAGSSE